ncbi:myosin type-2 heavy chain 1 isoform X2 [Drosophila willistoni]|uniref:myosin type-2 heavy chain 1 isoform X2 n=1 Tax=Drosophila willistoni TaxID=7260 RepID=UPI001F086CF3|nr:myosin type-2 heavy chain 1 isoform X2 [Drosophila willistoni]
MSGILFGRYTAYRRSLGFLYVSYRPGSISLASSIQHQRREKHQDTSADDGKGDGRGGATVDDKTKVRATRLRQVKPIEVRQNISKKNNPNVEKPTVISGPETSGLKTSFIECDKTSPSKVNPIPEIPMERKHESPFEFLPELPLPGQMNPVEIQPKDPLKVTCQAADSSNEMESSEARKDQQLIPELGQSYHIIQAELLNEENDPHTMKLLSEYTNFPNPALNFDFRISSFEMLQKQIEADTKFRADLKAMRAKSENKSDAQPASNTEIRDANFEVLKSQIEAENKFRLGEYTPSTPATIKADQETIDVTATTVFSQAKEQNENSEDVLGSITKNEEKFESFSPSPNKMSTKIEIKTQPICEAVCELQNAVSKIATIKSDQETIDVQATTVFSQVKEQSEKSEDVLGFITKNEEKHESISPSPNKIFKKIEIKTQPICEAVCELQNAVSKIAENATKTSNKKENVEVDETSSEKKSTSRVESDIQKLYSKMQNESGFENISTSADITSNVESEVKSDVKKLYSKMQNESSSENSKVESGISSDVQKLYSKLWNEYSTKKSKVESGINSEVNKLYSKMQSPELTDSITEVTKTAKINESASPNAIQVLYAKIETPESLQYTTQSKIRNDSKPIVANQFKTKPPLENISSQKTNKSMASSTGTNEQNDKATADIVAMFDQFYDDKSKMNTEEPSIKSTDQSKSTKDLLKATSEKAQSEIKSSLEKPEVNTKSQDNVDSEETTQNFNLETVSTNFVKMRNEARNKNKKEASEEAEDESSDTLYIPEEALYTEEEIKARKNRKATKQGKSKKSTPQLDDGELGVKLVSQNPEDSAPIKAEKSGFVQYFFDKIFSVGKKKGNTGRRTMATFSGSHLNNTKKAKSELKTKNLKQEPIMGDVYISPALDEQGLGAKNIRKAREIAEQKNDIQRKISSHEVKDDSFTSLEVNEQIASDTTKSIRENIEHSQIICGSLKDKPKKIREMAKSNGDGGKPSFTSAWQRLTRMVWFYIFPDAATAAAPPTKSK